MIKNLMTYLNVIALMLSVWRITEIATTQDGPFSVFKRLRTRWKLLQCPFCFSVWAAVIGLAMFHFWPLGNWIFALSWSYGFSALFTKHLATWANEGSKKGRELLIAENNGQVSVVRSDFADSEHLAMFKGFTVNLSKDVPSSPM